LEVELEEFAILNTPEGILNLDFFTKLALKERFLSFKCTGYVLWLNLDFELIRLGSLR
jgi:hypothetical protein